MLKEQLASGGVVNVTNFQGNRAIGDNGDFKQMENVLREKDSMLGKNNAEKNQLAGRIQELERDMERKLVR
jgi:hypothetical protein